MSCKNEIQVALCNHSNRMYETVPVFVRLDILNAGSEKMNWKADWYWVMVLF